MSSVGRSVCEHINYGFDALERLGGLMPWEEKRIRSGDYRPIVRYLEPAFCPGQQIVLSWRRIRAQAIYDDFGRLTGEVVPAKQTPTLVITIRGKHRPTPNEWEIRFDVYDARDPTRFIRRTPPAQDLEAAALVPTAEEIAIAHVESNYSGSPRAAADDQAAVDDSWLDRNTAETRAIEVIAARARESNAAAARRKQKTLEQELADTLRECADKGIDTTSVRFITERQIARLRRRLDKVA